MSTTHGPEVDGVTFEPERDAERLSSQRVRVLALMLDSEWRTLAQIATAVQGSEAGVSARLRDFRKAKFGGYQVERRRVVGGLWQYRVLLPEPERSSGWLF